MTKPLDPLEMLLDAARFIGAEKPAWAMAAREAVQHARAQPPTALEPVAWRAENDFGHWYVTQDPALADTWRKIEQFEVQPLYAALSVPPGDQAREASSALTKLAAECHRAKWEFDLSDDYKPTASAARGLILKAFQELHRIGDIAMNLRAEVKKP